MHKWWGILFGVVMIGAVLIFIAAPFVNWWLPKNVASFGGEVDNLFYLILAITGFFFILTESILVYNIFKFGAESTQKAPYTHGNHKLEIFWTTVPAAILLLIAFLQISTWEKIKYYARMPEPDQVFEVSARQFEWRMRYPTSDQMNTLTTAWKTEKKEPKEARSWSESPHADDIHVVNEVHTWKGAHVRLYLKTKDVLHSFYLPNLRLKQDAVPGKTIPVWFEVTDFNTKEKSPNRWVDGYDPQGSKFDNGTQVWDLACAELCGWGHYKMLGRLYVHETKADYEKWLSYSQEEQRRSKPADVATTAAR